MGASSRFRVDLEPKGLGFRVSVQVPFSTAPVSAASRCLHGDKNKRSSPIIHDEGLRPGAAAAAGHSTLSGTAPARAAAARAAAARAAILLSAARCSSGYHRQQHIFKSFVNTANKGMRSDTPVSSCCCCGIDWSCCRWCCCSFCC